MKTVFIDNYTKGLLTIIALCLVLLTVNAMGLFPGVQASDALNDKADIAKYGLIPVNEDGTISVRLIAGDEIDVNISNISTSDELEVNIAEIGGGYVSYGGPIAVEIE